MELSEDVANYTRGVQMLLFCIGLNGISEIAGKTHYGYRLQNKLSATCFAWITPSCKPGVVNETSGNE